MKVRIPFGNHFENAILKDIKIYTSRTKKYGNVGDTFEAFGQEFVITSIEKWPLRDIARYFYKEEGLNSPEDFIILWNMLHPRKRWLPDQVVWLHGFERKRE